MTLSDVAAVVARLLLYVGALLAIGAPVALLVQRVAPLHRPAVVRGPERLGWVLVGIALFILLVAQFRALDMPMAGETLAIVLRQTTWGQGWVALVVIMALGALAALARRTVVARLALGLCLAAAMGGLGHAAADELVWLARPLDALHVGAVAVWIGTLLCLPANLAPEHWRRFSAVAQWAAPLAVLTGVGSGWRRVGAAPLMGILESRYGWLLAGKVALVLAVLVLGAAHRKQLLRDAVPTARSVRTELLLAALVVAVTGVLTGTAPPGE